MEATAATPCNHPCPFPQPLPLPDISSTRPFPESVDAGSQANLLEHLGPGDPGWLPRVPLCYSQAKSPQCKTSPGERGNHSPVPHLRTARGGGGGQGLLPSALPRPRHLIQVQCGYCRQQDNCPSPHLALPPPAALPVSPGLLAPGTRFPHTRPHTCYATHSPTHLSTCSSFRRGPSLREVKKLAKGLGI